MYRGWNSAPHLASNRPGGGSNGLIEHLIHKQLSADLSHDSLILPLFFHQAFDPYSTDETPSWQL